MPAREKDKREEKKVPPHDMAVEALRKITVSFQAGTLRDRTDIELDSKEAEFIFGIGSGGLTDLEATLAGKKIGETIVLPVDPDRLPAAAGHLCRHMPTISGNDRRVYLHIRVEKIREAENREIVKALAQASACGEGCSCGGH